MDNQGAFYITQPNYALCAANEYWTVIEAVQYATCYNLRNNRYDSEILCQAECTNYLEALYEVVVRSIKAGTLQASKVFYEEYDEEVGRTIDRADLKSSRIPPKNFVLWAKDKNIELPDEFIRLITKSTAVEIVEASGNGTDKINKLRNNQRHRERSRAIAAYLWNISPDVTIADMILSDAIVLYGCENKIYSEKVMREWINDLCPNRAPGRRPGD